MKSFRLSLAILALPLAGCASMDTITLSTGQQVAIVTGCQPSICTQAMFAEQMPGSGVLVPVPAGTGPGPLGVIAGTAGQVASAAMMPASAPVISSTIGVVASGGNGGNGTATSN